MDPVTAQLDPIEAALELERRGYNLSADIRAKLDRARQASQISTPGIDEPGMTVRGRQQAPAGYAGPTFKLPGGAMSVPRGTPSTAYPQSVPTQSPALVDAAIMGPPAPSLAGPTQTLPSGEQALLSSGSALDPDLEIATIIADFNRRGRQGAGAPAFWGQLPWNEQVEFARNYARIRSERMKALPRNAAVDAQQGHAMLEASQRGDIQLSVDQQDAARQAIETRETQQKQANLEAEAARQGTIGAFGHSAANALTLGGFAGARDLIYPEMQGLESVMAEQSPIATAVGQFAGAAPLIMTGAAAGAAGGAALAARAGAGTAGRVVGAVGGRFLGGELAQAPIATGQALSQGAGIADALKAGGEAAASIPILAAKIPAVLRGEQELTIDDRLNMAFVILEAAGLPKDFNALMNLAPGPKRKAAMVARALIEDIERPVDPGLLQEALTSMQPREADLSKAPAPTEPEFSLAPAQSTIALDDPLVKRQLESERMAKEMEDESDLQGAAMVRQGAQRDLPGQLVEEGVFDATGLPYRIEQLESGEFRHTTLDESGQPISRGFAPDLEAARAQMAEQLPPSRDAFRGSVESMGGLENLKQAVEKVKAARPEAPKGEFDYSLTEKPKMKEVLEIRKAMRARQYTPGALVHTTGISSLESISKGGIQPTRDADGDESVSASRVNEKGEVTGGALSYGRGDIPVVLEMSPKAVRAASEGPGDTFVRSGDKSYVRPEDIERVYIGADPKPYTLQEAVARIQQLKGKPAAEPSVAKAPEAKAASEVKPAPKTPETMTSRERRAEAKRLGVVQHDNKPGQPDLIARLNEAIKKEAEANEAKAKAPEPEPERATEPVGPDTQAPEDHLGGVARAAADLLKQEPGAVKWSEIPDEALLIAKRDSTLNTPIAKAIELQAKARGLEQAGITDAEVSVRLAERQIRDLDRRDLPDAMEKWPDATVEAIARKKKAGPISKLVRAEADRRGVVYKESGSGGSAAGSPASPIGRSVQFVRALRNGGRAAADPMSPHAIISDLNRKLGLGPIGIGGARMLKTTWALGFYRVVPESIRLRMAAALDTHIHEIGHHLHKLVLQQGKSIRGLYYNKKGKLVRESRTGLTRDVIPFPWRSELTDLGKALYGKRKPAAGYTSEGFAELVRLAFTDPNLAFQKAPTAFTDLMRLLQREHTDTYKALVEFRRRYETFHAQSPTTKVALYINRNGPDNDDWNWIARFRSKWVDRTYPVVAMMRDLGIDPERGLPENINPRILALRSESMIGDDFGVAMRDGPFDPVTRQVYDNAVPLEQILGDVKDHWSEFETYMVAQRAIGRRKNGEKGVFAGIDDADLTNAVAELETNYPHFKDTSAKFDVFRRWFVEDYAVKMGLINADSAKRILDADLFYLPFRKVKTDSSTNRGGRRKAASREFSGAGSSFKRFAKFQGEQIFPPLETFLANMQTTIATAHSQNVARSIVDLFEADPRNSKMETGGVEGIGRWVDKVERPVEAVKLYTDDIVEGIAKRLRAAGYDKQTAKDFADDLANLIDTDEMTFFKPGIRVDRGSRRFIVLKDGKPTFWEAKNQMLFDFLEGMGSTHTAPFMFRFLRSMLREGATSLNLPFAFANFFRDLTQALITSENGVQFFTRTKGMWRAISKGDPGALYRLSGAGQSGLFSEYKNPRTNRVEIDKMFGRRHEIKAAWSRKKYASALAKVAASPIYGIRAINERFELANRLAEFETSLRRQDAGDKPTAAQLARAGQDAADITIDFSRGGTWGKGINQYIPFFNAFIQGTDKMYRQFKRAPVQTAARVMLYTVTPSLAAHLLNRDRKEYWDLPYQERDRYWYVWVGHPGGEQLWLRFPKPYGFGVLSVAIERMLARMDGIDPITGKRGDSEASRGAAISILDQFRPPYSVPVLTPAMELWMNYSLFYGSPIVRQGEQFGPVSERGEERASDLAFVLAKTMGDRVAPVQIDYAISQFLGGFGADINKFLVSPAVRLVREDVLGHTPKMRKEFAGMAPEDWFFVRRFLVSEPKTHSETLGRFWDAWDEVETAYEGISRLRDQPKRQREYIRDNMVKIRAYRLLQPIKSQMDETYSQIRSSYRREDADPERTEVLQKRLLERLKHLSRVGLTALQRGAKEDGPSE